MYIVSPAPPRALRDECHSFALASSLRMVYGSRTIIDPPAAAAILASTRNHLRLWSSQTTAGCHGPIRLVWTSADSSNRAIRPNREYAAASTKNSPIHSRYRCTAELVSRGISTLFSQRRVEIQRLSAPRNRRVGCLHSISPTPTATPTTLNTRKNCAIDGATSVST